MQLINVLLNICLFLYLAEAQTYRARVLDFTPKDEGDSILTPNFNIKQIEDNVGGSADIVVFPEYVLTTVEVLDKPNYADYAIVVPEAGNTDFCEVRDAHATINKLSCVAKQKSIYIVVNLLEKDKKKSGVIYNTNVVFDRNGFLIAKYRKINLYGSEVGKLTEGTELVTFKTDFDVTFGLFTCYDILFRKPAIEILGKGVTDIIFPTAWISEIPFLTALQVQDGYARKTGVNLLVSGYNNPKNGSGGSGIYLANGERELTINTVKGIKGLERDVTKLTKRDENYGCGEVRAEQDQRRIGKPIDIIDFYTKNDVASNFPSYNFEQLSTSKLEQSSELCSPDKKICCSFSAKLRETLDGKDFTYMFAVYSKLDRGCALLSCNSTDPRTCGNRLRTKGFVFEEVDIRSNITETYVIPSTLTFEMKPVSFYKFCSKASKHEIKGRALTSITTFGIYSINGAATITNTVVILICACIVSLNIFK